MENEEILGRAVKKAIKNGFNPGKLEPCKEKSNADRMFGSNYCALCSYKIIFSHSFAKAFWGIKPKHQIFGDYDSLHPLWEDALTQMVLEKEPLKYIEKFL